VPGLAIAAVAAHGPGFYGKLPSRGDFVSRRLPQPFVAHWDAWLQQGLAASQVALGQRWLDVYLTSPIWRFAVASRVCGDAAYCGVLVPSVDRVGRYFPLTAAIALPPGTAPGAFVALERWYSEVEELLLATLADDSLDLESFDARLAALSAPAAPAAPAALTETAGFAFAGVENALAPAPVATWHYALATIAEAPTVLLAPLSAALDGLMGHSVWWTQGSERVGPCALFASGLPEQRAFVALLDGAFEAHGWMSAPRIAARARRDTARLRSAAATDVGKTRNVNEDSYAVRDDLGVFIVADGLGGHQAGDVASSMVTSVVEQLDSAASLRERVELLVRALRTVNGCLIAFAETTRAAGVAGSTVAVLLIDGGSAACVWAGDSRIYRLRDGELVQLTRDHSEAPGAAGNRAVTRAVGGVRELDLEVEYHDALADDRYLLCTDGLYAEIDVALLAKALALRDAAAACDELKAGALRGDANDNLTAVVVHVGDRAEAIA
jgi:type VI secretion system protein ImpM